MYLRWHGVLVDSAEHHLDFCSLKCTPLSMSALVMLDWSLIDERCARQ